MRIKSVVLFNISVTSFNASLVGSTIYMFVGALDAGFLAGILKMSGVLSNIISGRLQKKCSAMSLKKLIPLCFRAEVLSALVYSTGNFVVVYNLPIGISMLLIGRVVHSISCALYDIKLEHQVSQFTDGSNVSRSAWRGEVRVVSSVADTFGTLINICVFLLCTFMAVGDLNAMKYILTTHAILTILDVVVSYVEFNISKSVFL